jgi:hypothetical protein
MTHTTLPFESLRNLAAKAIKDCDPEDYVGEICDAIRKPIRQYVQNLLQIDGVPESGSGWGIGPIELLLVELEPGSYVPSVRGGAWDAPASSWGVAFDTPIDALSAGLEDAIAYELADELSPDEDDEE